MKDPHRHSEGVSEIQLEADRAILAGLSAHLDAASKGISQSRTAKMLQTAALRDSRTRRNPRAEQALYVHLRAAERYLTALSWYRHRLEGAL